jgi:hypothetical protein
MSQYGQFYLQTDAATYHPGETVTGKVYLNLTKTFPGNKIVIRLKGKEHVEFSKRRQCCRSCETLCFCCCIANNHHSQSCTTYHNNKWVIMTYEIPVLDNNGKDLPPGQSVIPFSIQLPENLPSSYFIIKQTVVGAISYHMEAVIHENGTTNRLKHRGRIFIREHPENLPP